MYVRKGFNLVSLMQQKLSVQARKISRWRNLQFVLCATGHGRTSVWVIILRYQLQILLKICVLREISILILHCLNVATTCENWVDAYRGIVVLSAVCLWGLWGYITERNLCKPEDQPLRWLACVTVVGSLIFCARRSSRSSTTSLTGRRDVTLDSLSSRSLTRWTCQNGWWSAALPVAWSVCCSVTCAHSLLAKVNFVAWKWCWLNARIVFGRRKVHFDWENYGYAYEKRALVLRWYGLPRMVNPAVYIQ